MKAIYINLDPYLAAFAAWLKGGKVGPAPTFSPLPLAVTVPLGEEVCIFLPAQSGNDPTGKINPEEPDADWDASHTTIDGVSVWAASNAPSAANLIDSALVPGLSALAPGMRFAAVRFTGGPVKIYLSGDDVDGISIPFTVLVRREQPSGPVDLVDLTPPAAAPSAADIKSALVAAGNGALAGVLINGMRYLKDDETDSSSINSITPDPASTTGGAAVLIISSPGS